MFRTLNRRLVIPIAAAITVSLLAVVVFYSLAQQRNILQQNERSVYKVTNSVVHGLQTIMLAGYADVAEQFSERLKAIAGVVDFRILRTTGVEAFKDNQTIRQVNARRGEDQFSARQTEALVQVLPVDQPALKAVLASKRFVSYYEDGKDERTLTFLWPILNDTACRKCHGGDHEIRGVLKLSTSLKAVDEEVAQTWQAATMVMTLALIGIVLAMAYIVRRWIVSPITAVSHAMGRVSAGDLSEAVPVLGRDELANMAQSFNAMLQELRETYGGFKNERNKLETIIFGSRDGIVVTDGAGKVVLANAAASEMLGKSIPEIVDAGFETLFDDPLRVQGLLAQSAGGGSDVIYFRERYLAVSAASIFNDHGGLLGRAALLRDISEEKRLEQALRALSNTDGLTGLNNRRMLDESLAREVARCLKHGHPLSVLMFDVDHFKKFNDVHGHDQGDRVLRQVAIEARNSLRTIDLPCRYGGEEFLLILIETAQEGAMIVAERLRASIEKMRVDDLQVTVTIGVAGIVETAVGTADDLIARADAALYEGKHAGRNRVAAAKPAGVSR